MNHIRRIAAVLAGLAATMAVFAATGPAASAMQVPVPGQLGTHPANHAAATPARIHTIVIGGMAGRSPSSLPRPRCSPPCWPFSSTAHSPPGGGRPRTPRP
jgi:hypothetical protein